MNLDDIVCSAVLVMSISSTLSGCATVGKCSLDGCAGDAAITTNVRGLLDQHPELGPPRSIEVQTFHGVVYLNGLVSGGLDRNIAESVVLKTPGVLKVVNSIAAEN